MENEYDPRYQEGKIYKIVCNITNEVYYGSTTQELNERLGTHKQQKCSSKQILDRCDYKIELIKDYPCNSKWELEEEEAKYIKNNTCINNNIPHRTRKEYREDNKEIIKEKQKQDKINNPEKYKEKSKKYRDKYKEEINKKQREDRKNNPEKYKQHDKNKYEKNKKKILEKQAERILCDCGEMVRRNSIARHKRSIKHLKLTECLIID